jgi:hypothetical protein
MAITFELDELQDGSISVQSVTIDGREIKAHQGDDSIAIPKSLLEGVLVADVDHRVGIEPAEVVDDDFITLDGPPYRLYCAAGDKATASFDETMRRKYWSGPVGLDVFMEAKKKAIEDRAKGVGDITLDEYEDEGDYITLTYSATFSGKTLGEIMRQAEQLATEIDGAATLSLGKPFKTAAEAESEKDFTLSTVIPLLRKLGFANVKYNHGKREYGKDITFTSLTAFDEFERWGAQVKLGDIGGGVKSEVDEIIGQANDAFRMPYHDVYSRSSARISKLAIIISGKFKENAVEKIIEGIENHALRNNMVFIDGDKIATLSERFRALA